MLFVKPLVNHYFAMEVTADNRKRAREEEPTAVPREHFGRSHKRSYIALRFLGEVRDDLANLEAIAMHGADMTDAQLEQTLKKIGGSLKRAYIELKK